MIWLKYWQQGDSVCLLRIFAMNTDHVDNHPFFIFIAVLEFDRNAEGEIGNLGKKILQKQFEAYNKAWLGMRESMCHNHNLVFF